MHELVTHFSFCPMPIETPVKYSLDMTRIEVLCVLQLVVIIIVIIYYTNG